MNCTACPEETGQWVCRSITSHGEDGTPAELAGVPDVFVRLRLLWSAAVAGRQHEAVVGVEKGVGRAELLSEFADFGFVKEQ